MSETHDAYEGWAILELMGHRRLGGRVQQVEQYGSAMIRIDVPALPGQEAFTQFYSGQSLYAVTPTTEEVALRVAANSRIAPVDRFELPRLPPHEDVDDDAEDEYQDESDVPY